MRVEHEGSATTRPGESSEHTDAARFRLEFTNVKSDATQHACDVVADFGFTRAAGNQSRIDGVDADEIRECLKQKIAIELTIT
jgi:hypothetical protein